MDRQEARRAVKKALTEKGARAGASSPTPDTAAGASARAAWSSRCDLSLVVSQHEARWPTGPSKRSTPGKTEIIPAEWEKTYDHFLENIQDWSVSRQLW